MKAQEDLAMDTQTDRLKGRRHFLSGIAATTTALGGVALLVACESGASPTAPTAAPAAQPTAAPATSIVAATPATTTAPATTMVEPRAGTWKTWVLASGDQFRLSPPPDRDATVAELGQLKELAGQRDAAAHDKIAYWNTGAPGYRWNTMLRDELVGHGIVASSATTARQRSLVAIAIYDAIIAAWDSKYAFLRPRPSQADTTLETVIAAPRSPSFPSEHAAAAGAAATVLTYLFPDHAEAFATKAQEAAQSRLLAGVEFPSDSKAGLDLGRRVGGLVVERAKQDGMEVPWTGSIPTERGKWSLTGYPAGTAPVAPAFGTLRPWVLGSGNQFRPGPPPAFDSSQEITDLAEIKNFTCTFVSNAAGFYWQSIRSEWSLLAEQKVFEYRLEDNPPRAARVDALLNVAAFDAIIACWDAKFTYWAIRPFQLDHDVKPIFQTPAHPSYPAAHGAYSGSQAAILAYLFPTEADSITARGEEAGMSRMWSGIHFRSDISAGLALGRTVAQKVIERARVDGSS
jgi:membrane-associated phospholipid phosphatase